MLGKNVLVHPHTMYVLFIRVMKVVKLSYSLSSLAPPPTTPYYPLLPSTTPYYSLLPSTTPYYSLLPSTTPYYSLLPPTTPYYPLLLPTTPYYPPLLPFPSTQSGALMAVVTSITYQHPDSHFYIIFLPFVPIPAVWVSVCTCACVYV